MIDLGVDVPAQKFVQAVQQSNAQVVGMSVFLTSCFESAENVVKAIKGAALRHKVKIMIGGAPITGMVAEQTGCDFHGENAAAHRSHHTRCSSGSSIILVTSARNSDPIAPSTAL